MYITTNLKDNTASSPNQFPQRTSIVSSLELANRSFRLDPTHFNERSDNVLRHFKALAIQTRRIGDWDVIKKVQIPDRFRRQYLDKKADGIPFLSSSSMLALRLPRDAQLPRTLHKVDNYVVQGGELLLSRSGTIGESVICGASYEGFAVSEDAARLYVDVAVRGYLHTYFSSAPGHELVLQQNHGKVIRHLTEDQIKDVVVPVVQEAQFNQINELALRAVSLFDSARVALGRAQGELERLLQPMPKLGGDAWLNPKHRTYIFAHDMGPGARIDPHFRDPQIEVIRHVLRSRRHKLLGSIAHVWNPSRFARPSAEPGHGIPFFSSADLMRARRKPGTTIAKRAVRLLKQCRVKSGTIIVCRSGAFGGIMGRATFVTPAMNDWAVTEHMLRCEIHDPGFIPEFVYAFLSSARYGYPLITSIRHGKDVPEIDPHELGELVIPYVDEADQVRVASHIINAFAFVDEANSAEDEALHLLLTSLTWPNTVGVPQVHNQTQQQQNGEIDDEG